MRVLLVFCACALALPAWAAPSVKVLADRVLTGHPNQEFVPRFVKYLPNVLVVPAGQTVTLADSAVTYDAIEVAGTLQCSTQTAISVTHFVVLPGGTFDGRSCGSIEFRDVPIDTSRDPYQFGNGLVNMGTLRLEGRSVIAFTELTADAAAGATTLELQVPADWVVGDELLVPDMRQMRHSDWADQRREPRREAPVVIAARTATSITLSKPLDFEHLAIRDPDGVVKYFPVVANITRSQTLRSANPRGTRGHVIMLGHDATWDVRGVGLLDLGRTKPINLHSAEARPDGTITRVGTNQNGRYTFHVHHSQGHRTVFRGNVLHDTLGVSKWGHATHGTHDSLIEGNIGVGFIGASFVTEDGYETRNVYRRNLAAYSKGNGVGGKDNMEPPQDMPGAEGAGFWLRAMHNTLDGNVSVSNAIGFQLMYRRQIAGLAPRVPGGHPDTEVNMRAVVPISFDGNKAFSNAEAGFETWGAPYALLATNLHVANNGRQQIFTGSGEAGSFWAKNVFVYAQEGVTAGVEISAAYIRSVRIDGGEIRGTGVGIREAQDLILTNLLMQNTTNIDHSQFRPNRSSFENVLHKPLGHLPKRYVVVGPGSDWKPGDPMPTPNYVSGWVPSQGSRYQVRNWQGTGKNFLLYATQQLRSKPAWPSQEGYLRQTYCPVPGLTMGECWDRYGVAYGGGVIDEADAVPLDGVVHGVARAGLAEPPLPAPKAVLGLPNALAPAMVQDGAVTFWVGLTGDPSQANDIAVVQIDDGKPVRVAPRDSTEHALRAFRSPVVSEGLHTVVTWRETPDAKRLPGSELRFTYFVGASPSATGATAQSREHVARREENPD